MSEMCKKCLAAAEDLPQEYELWKCPEGCCVVCWRRYGQFIPVCKTGKELLKDDDTTK